MKTLTVAVIGNEKRFDWRKVYLKLMRVISTLIEEENAETFLFGRSFYFNSLCYDVVTYLKQRFFPLVMRVHATPKSKKSDKDYKKFVFSNFDDTVYSESQNYEYAIIDMCDILLTFYDEEYHLTSGKSSITKTAYEYAVKKNKRIINIFEMIK